MNYSLIGEWTQDWYNHEYYRKLLKNEVNKNPKGPERTNNPYAQEKIVKGGSFYDTILTVRVIEYQKEWQQVLILDYNI